MLSACDQEVGSRSTDEIADADGNVVGRVTSGTMSPSLKKGIGLGYVPVELAGADTEVSIIIRNKPVKAVVTKPPFYKA